MLSFTIMFLTGDLITQFLPTLPPIWLLILIVLLTICIAVFSFKQKQSLLGLLFGFLWTTFYAHYTLNWTLPKSLENKPLWISGYIKSIPATTAFDTSFIFQLLDLPNDQQIDHPNVAIKLTLGRKQQYLETFNVGQKWMFPVKLKRIHAAQSPGVFDYEAWALQKGIRATGYILPTAPPQLIGSTHHALLNQWRQQLQSKLMPLLPHTPEAPWLLALVLGERNGIATDQWQILRNTGTNHLMAIAGLHIGLVSGCIYAIALFLARCIPRLLYYIPAKQIAAAAALLFSLFYSALAGFSLPTQRACFMISIYMLTVLWRQHANPWHAWGFALLMVLILNPLCILGESFWLSFGTIALIIYCMHGRLGPHGWWWRWGRIQWIIGLGLIPFTIALFQEFSLISFLANSIAIPWLAFFILPFCLLAVVTLPFSTSITTGLLWMAGTSLSGLWMVLTYLAQLAYANWQIAFPNNWIFLTTIICSLLFLLPRGTPGKLLSVIWFLPMLTFKPAQPPPGHFWFTLFDVGQGLAVMIETNQHRLLYDSGPKFLSGADMGERVILPYLQLRRINRIDKLILSHADLDHVGGLKTIVTKKTVDSISTSAPRKVNTLLSGQADLHQRIRACIAGTAWQWDGVSFTFLYPNQKQGVIGNDRSCVLRISNATTTVLLTGDIEKRAEKYLITNKADQLAATLIVAPHHGSQTSGLAAFIQAVRPAYVLYATGYLNRYHFPSSKVTSIYDQMGAQSQNTASSGTIQLKTEQILTPIAYRDAHQRYWYDNQ